MEQIDFQPKLENFQTFYKKRDNKKRKMKEIDQILSFNTKQSKTSSDETIFNSDFDSNTWKNLQKEENKEDFFQQQGKNLLNDEQSFKKINKKNLLFDQFLHLLALIWCIWDSYPFWSYLMSIIVLIINGYYLSLDLNQVCFDLYKHHENPRSKLNKLYECLLISSILASVAATIHGLFMIAIKTAFISGAKFIIYLGIINFQLKLIKNIKYIIWIESQTSKKQSNSFQNQSQTLQFN